MAGHSRNRPRRHRHFFTWGQLTLVLEVPGDFTATRLIPGPWGWSCSCGRIAHAKPKRHGNRLDPYRRRSPRSRIPTPENAERMRQATEGYALLRRLEQQTRTRTRRH